MLNAHGLLWVVCLLNFLIVWLDLLVVTTWDPETGHRVIGGSGAS